MLGSFGRNQRGHSLKIGVTPEVMVVKLELELEPQPIATKPCYRQI
jgi:hypothetical protein